MPIFLLDALVVNATKLSDLRIYSETGSRDLQPVTKNQ